MLKVYGMILCPDCAECCAEFDKAGISYEFLEFSGSVLNLKEFLKIRDNNVVFDEAKLAGSIGIPCIVKEDGTVTLDWKACM